MALQQAIDDWHRLLTPELAGESQERLDEQLRRRGLFFGERPLCTVLRPRFMTAEQYRLLRRKGALVLGAFRKAHRRALEDAAFRARFALDEWEEELFLEDPGFDEPSPVSRLDAFFVSERGGLRFTEYNAETPAGAAYGDALAEVFLTLPIMREFLHRWEVRPQPARHNVLHALVWTWQQWSGQRRLPRIGVIDWHDVPTFSEFRLSVDYFRGQGLEALIADPRDLEYRDGKLTAEGHVIDLVYKRVLINELVEREGLDQPLVRAVRDRAVCMVNPFRCKALHKKASLAVLSDEANEELFTGEELEAIEDHVPWTRLLEERHTLFHEEEVDLLPFARDHRERLVLKPNDEYGGKGIVLGWEVSDDEWGRAIAAAVESPHIVQERIGLPRESYPSMEGGSLHWADRVVDTAPFVFHGTFVDGCLTRLSTESLVNVTAGGGSSVATFVVEPR